MTEELEQPLTDREAALRQLKKRRDFHGHLAAYLVVNAAVWLVWATVGGGGYPWPLWVTGCWGVGLLLNAWEVYLRKPITESDIDREIKRLQAGH